MKSDVIVVGAGPAGASAAYFLAGAGIDVLLVDREVFPRQKVCGDGLASRALVVLERMGLGDWLKGFPEPEVMLFSSPNGEAVRIRPDRRDGFCYGRGIPRLRLDEAIVERAVMAGAPLLDGTKVTSLEQQKGGLYLRGERNGQIVRLDTRLVIAADGGQASFTRRLGLIHQPPDLVAVRAYFEGDVGPQNRPEIHLEQAIMPGYNWIFPLGGGRANVGTGTLVSTVKEGSLSLAKMMRQFATSNPYARERLRLAEMVSPVQGHPLRTDLRGTRAYDQRVLVAGEAAGLVNPLSGEGIAYALESGEMAATHARRALESGDFSEAALSAYSRALHRRYGADHQAARFLRIFFKYPWLLNRLVRRMQQDPDFALTFGLVVIGVESPRTVLSPRFLSRLFL
ncbi:MAG: NAD(P)/FAD-dependent oxidoreductase [Anaerolineae bacterium]